MSREYELSQIRENKLAANKTLLFLPLGLFAFVLNQLGVYRINQMASCINMTVVLIGVVAIQIIGRIEQLAKRSITKFIVLGLCFLMTLSSLAFLNFHAILVLCFPMIVAFNYHSKKIAIMTFVLTNICAFFWPIIGAGCKIWQVDFFVFLIDEIDPYLIENTDLVNFRTVVFPTLWEVIKFISIPQVGFALVFGGVVLLSNKISRSNYDRQIKELEESRDQILSGLSDIVESRDSNTGGHIKRSCMVVKHLVETLSQDDEYKNIDKRFVDNVIRTAPMHDLGKIAIPDKILNKPGKLTDEEFEYIMIHPQKSFDIVESVLIGLNDKELLNVAENIALYHHERYDGSGYPMGLRGDEIPLEARIMTIADVYDALVSRRCYKKPISHEEAYMVIKNSMGTQFDPKLWKYFEKAYPQIVEFYS